MRKKDPQGSPGRSQLLLVLQRSNWVHATQTCIGLKYRAAWKGEDELQDALFLFIPKKFSCCKDFKAAHFCPKQKTSLYASCCQGGGGISVIQINPHNQLSKNMGKDKKNLAGTLKLNFQFMLESP